MYLLVLKLWYVMKMSTVSRKIPYIVAAIAVMSKTLNEVVGFVRVLQLSG